MAGKRTSLHRPEPARTFERPRNVETRHRFRAALVKEIGLRIGRLVRALRSEELQIAFLALIVGALAGYAATGFRLLIGWIQYLFYGETGEKLYSTALALPWWQILLAPTVCGLIVGLFIRYALSDRRPQGVADVIEAAALRDGRMSFRHAALASLANAASIGGGASVGREGPVVLLGASLASTIAKRLGYSRSAMLTMMGCGAASAVAASFNAPLAGALFALEVVVGNYRLKAFAPVVMASVTGTIVSRLHFGDFPAFIKPEYEIASFFEFPAFALLGVSAAVATVAMMSAIILISMSARRMPWPTWANTAFAGLLVGAIALVFPQVLGVGYEVTDRALRGDFGFWLLIGIIVAKIVATGLSIGGGFGGGVFSPSLMLGAMVGAAFGALAGSVFPDIASDRGAYTLVGMGAVAGAVLGAPISTILIIFELTGDYKVTLGVMVAVVIASAITQVVFGRSFFHWQLSSRGIMAHLDYAERQIQRTTMASLALPTAPVMHHSCTIADAQTMLLAAPSRIIYVVDDKGELRGAVGLGDLFAFGSDAVREAHEAVEHVMRKPPFLLAEDNIEDAIQLFSRSSEVILPVVKDRSQRILVGEVRQRDVMVAYHDAHEAAREA